MKTNTKNKLIIVVAIVVAVTGTVIYWQQQLKTKKAVEEQKRIEAEIKLPSINGVPVSESIAKTRPIAAVIENHVDARPQSGLTGADIIYETLAEGGITRFLALFQSHSPKEIGPIRSARPYFNFLANQWGAGYAHVGGSTIALSELDNGVYKKLTDINQYFIGDYFYRSKERFAPHNAYTSAELMRAYLEKKKLEDWSPIRFGEFQTIPTAELQTTVSEINIKFFDPQYSAKFKFDPTVALYGRLSGGKIATDKNNDSQIFVRNVLVQYVDDYVVPLEKVNGIGLKLEGKGRAVLFTGGKAVDGTWQYSNGRTEYIDTEGTPQKFQPGQTWVVLMPKSLSANATWQ